MDKYEAKLEEARRKANIITKDVEYRIPLFKIVGTEQRASGNTYYYYDEGEDKYYSETDFDRYMRKKMRENRMKKYAKK